MNVKNVSYALACLSFSVIIGAGIYEHIAVWPVAYSEPPRSLTIFQGAYKLNAEAFWKMIHPVTLLLFITTLALHWKTARRKFIVAPLIAYAVILIITAAYFVPELISLTGTNYADTTDEALKSRGALWINLSLIRCLVLVASAITLFIGLTKPQTAAGHAKKQPAFDSKSTKKEEAERLVSLG